MDVKKYVGYAIVDSDGFFVDTISYLEDEPHEVLDNYVCPLIPNYVNPKWDFEAEEWIEGATQEEIEDYNKPPIREPTEVEKLQEQTEMNALAFMEFVEMMSKGGI